MLCIGSMTHGVLVKLDSEYASLCTYYQTHLLMVQQQILAIDIHPMSTGDSRGICARPSVKSKGVAQEQVEVGLCTFEIKQTLIPLSVPQSTSVRKDRCWQTRHIMRLAYEDSWSSSVNPIRETARP